MQKMLVTAALLLVLAVGCQPQEGESPEGEVSSTAALAENLTMVTFQVEELHCEGCCSNARNLLVALPGVQEVKTDLAAHTATLAVNEAEFDRDAALAELQELFPAAAYAEQAAAEEDPSAEDAS